jgi:hypothetical protein
VIPGDDRECDVKLEVSACSKVGLFCFVCMSSFRECGDVGCARMGM